MTPEEIQDAVDLAVDCCDGAECSDDDVDHLCGYVSRLANEVERLQRIEEAYVDLMAACGRVVGELQDAMKGGGE